MIKPTLLFVYNSDSGIFNALGDLAHKIFSPDTYSCNLCAITYSPFGMRMKWKKFLGGLGHSLEFLHRDELKSRYGIDDVPLPAIFTRKNKTLEIWMDAGSLNSCRDIEDLQQLILKKLAGSDGS